MLKAAADATQYPSRKLASVTHTLALLKNQPIQVTYGVPLYSFTAIHVWYRRIPLGDSKNRSTEWVYREAVGSEYDAKSKRKT